MTNKFTKTLLFAALLLLALFSCTKPTPFGSDLLDDQVADFDAVEVPVTCTVEYMDSVATSDRTSSFDYFLCGQLNDPEFGTTTSEIFSQITVSSNPVNFAGAVLDSIFLILPYNIAGVYGDTTISQSLRIFQLADTMNNSRNYYSNNTIAEGDEIGSLPSFMPLPSTSFKVLDTASTATKVPHLKIPLSQAFGEKLLAVDSLTMDNVFTFWRTMKGLKITSTTSETPGALLGFNLNSSTCFIRMYYSVNDTTHRTFNYVLRSAGTNKFMHFEHDYSGTPVQASVNVSNPSLLYLQGMSGTRLKVEFPTAAADFDRVLINKAELDLTIEGSSSFTDPAQMVVYRFIGDTTFVYGLDAQYSDAITSGGLSLFGGMPKKNADGLSHYQMTLTKAFQDIVDSDPSDPKKHTVYVQLAPLRSAPGRAVIYGVDHPQYPAKLRLKYTKF